MPSRDPRSYVRAEPLPIPPPTRLKMQARSETVFNPTVPTREDVRKWNYNRRQMQMSEQGFNALNYKPYKGIGDPFYLDEKKLILHSLGQWDENQEWETSSSSEDDDENAQSAAVPKASMTAAKFVLRRTRKDLNTLNKEVVKGRSMIRNVRLGHGLFDLIRQERLAKKVAAAAEKKKSLEQARNQWQAARDSSSDADSDGGYFGPSITDTHSEYGHPNDATSLADDGFRSPRSKLSSARSRFTSAGRKKKAAAPRPFTPQHNSLIEFTEFNEEISKEALFRQLCALNWILDAMNLEQGCSMAPISTSWSHLEIGGTKISAKRAGEERRAEKDWESWLNNQQRVQKKVRMNRLSRASRLLSHPRVSLQSTSISPSSSSSQVNNVAAPPFLTPAANQKEAGEARVVTPDEDETLHKTGIFKFLDEYYDSLRREEEAQRGVEPSPVPPTVTVEANQPQAPAEEGVVKKKKKHREGRSSKKSKNQDHLRLDSPEDRSRSRFILKDLRNDFNYKPRNTAELQEFHATKASVKYATLRQDLHNKFKEVQDDKAMTLHDVLEQMERERMTKCQNKFRGLQTHSMSFFRAVEEMRREGDRMLPRPEDMRRQSSFRGNWYTELLESIPIELKDIWFYRTVLQKLGRYGLVENTSKQSVYKFLKVLEGLRRWEICAPDVAAAVEFCRARIVDMSIEEFEEWFSQAFPKVVRPKTAPARASRGGATTTATAATAAGGDGDAVAGGGGSGGGGGGGRVAVTINNINPGITVISAENGGGAVRGMSGGSGGQGHSTGSVRLAPQGEGRGGARSAVSVANGWEGRNRMVQSAVVRRR